MAKRVCGLCSEITQGNMVHVKWGEADVAESMVSVCYECSSKLILAHLKQKEAGEVVK